MVNLVAPGSGVSRDVIANGKGQRKTRALKRLKVVNAFLTTNNSPLGMVLDELGPPVDGDRTGDVTDRIDRAGRPVGSPAQVEDPDPRSSELFRQPLGRGQEFRSGQATHRRYHTAVVVPFMPDTEKLAAIREAIPALAAGIYLNTGSVGPMPAETAAACHQRQEHEGTDRDADEDDDGRLELVDAQLDEEERGAPDRRQREQQAEVAP